MRTCASCHLLLEHADQGSRLQLIVWLIPSFIISAIAVSLIGMFLGPMYPVAISYTPLIMPRTLVNGAIGWITAIGGTGSALVPFLTGQIANKYGIGVMQPLCVSQNNMELVLTDRLYFSLVGMMVILLACWAVVPKAPPIADGDEIE